MSTQKKKGVKYTKKRKFRGNQHSIGQSKAKKVCVDQSESVSVTEASEAVQSESDMLMPRETSSFTRDTPTTSQKKLLFMYSVMEEGDSVIDAKNGNDAVAGEEDVPVVDSVPAGNRIIDTTVLSENVTSNLVCRFCHGSVSFYEVKRQGLDSEIAFHCSNRCNEQFSFHTCPQISIGNMSVCSINRRSVLPMRAIGGDRAELSMFCGVMDLPLPVHKSSFNMINKNLEKAACTVQQQSMAEAARMEYSQATPSDGGEIRNIDVSSDGTWMTRGHSSNIGAASTIGCMTGKVIDCGTRSKICKSCEVWEKRDKNSRSYRRWDNQHRDKCTLNHDGSSGGMESAIIKDIFSRSVEHYNLRYSRFIGD